MKEYNKFCSKIFKVTKHTACTHLWIGYNLSRKDCTIFEVYSLLFSICHLCLWLFTAEVNQLLRSDPHNIFPCTTWIIDRVEKLFVVADISDNILEVSGEKWLRWRMPVNKLARRILEREPDGTNKEMPEVWWREYDGVGLTMAWQKGSRERYMRRSLVMSEVKSLHVGQSLDDLNQWKNFDGNL
jgi:hypothetical protein